MKHMDEITALNQVVVKDVEFDIPWDGTDSPASACLFADGKLLVDKIAVCEAATLSQPAVVEQVDDRAAVDPIVDILG